MPKNQGSGNLCDQRKGLGRKRCPDGTMHRGNMLPVGRIVELPKRNTIIEDRLRESAAAILSGESDGTGFLHSILCQTSLPYRDPKGAREWERRQGSAALKLLAGEAIRPDSGEWVKIGLPFGPKARLVFCFINTRAVLTQSPLIEVGDSLTDFVTRELKMANKGQNMQKVKDQMARLAATHIRMGYIDGERSYNAHGAIISNFDLWFPKDERQRVLWPSVVKLSGDYFESLLSHAVPLEMRALSSLSHSALALDIYAWLAQRLHRIERGKRAFIPWAALQAQFGPDYSTTRKFRQKFMIALREAHTVYRAAKIDVTKEGLFLYNSPPPVTKTGVVLRLPRG
jgi:hypothetical protein